MKTINLPEIPKSSLFGRHRNMFSTVSVTAAVGQPHVVTVVSELHGCKCNISNEKIVKIIKYFVYALIRT